MTARKVLPFQVVAQSEPPTVTGVGVEQQWLSVSFAERYLEALAAYDSEPDIPEADFYQIIQFVEGYIRLSHAPKCPELGLSSFAERLGLNPETVQQWLRGRNAPTLEWVGARRFYARTLLRWVAEQPHPYRNV